MYFQSAVSTVIYAALFFDNIFAQTTNFINKEEKLIDFAEQQWYTDNIPFIEIPDKIVEQVYYYRWSSHKRHLRYTTPGSGYIVTEFVHKIAHSQKFDTINAAAGHHIYESRWLRNPRFVEDYINFWAREGAANQQYSEWIADAAYATYLVLGNTDFIVSQLDGLIKNFNGWSDRFNEDLNLYALSPHDDAMEHSASSEQTDDPYHGGLGYRPSFNSEMYANALAIAKIAKLANKTDLVEQFEEKASKIRSGILEHLWDNERKFFYHVYHDNNPNLEKLDTREEIGFFPWRFGVPDANPKYGEAWAHLFDPEGFSSRYGPTTCEQRSQWFNGNQTHQCCWWNGNSWPYSTGLVINSLAAQIRNFGSTEFASRESLLEVVHKYAETQFKNDKPYVAECHSPHEKIWVGDFFNNSEHYAHSTFVDNVLADVIGIEPQSHYSFVINPLIPSSWSYFIVENLHYHGNNISYYNTAAGKGLHVYVNGILRRSSPFLTKLVVAVPENGKLAGNLSTRLENYATNVNGFGYPRPDASYTSEYSSVWQAVDGRVFYDFVPSNRWTNYGSPNEKDWFSIDFGPGRKKTINGLKLFVYSDVFTGEGGVDCPVDVVVQVAINLPDSWTPVNNQKTTTCIPNDIMTIDFDDIKTQRIRLVFTRNQTENWFVGISEVEIWDVVFDISADSATTPPGWASQNHI